MKLKLSLMVAALACVAGAFELYPHGCGNKKIILTGWEFSTLTPEDFLANADALDKTPGDWYYFQGSVKGEGAWPSVNFRNAANKWLASRNYLAIEGANPDEWRTFRGCVQVPEDGAGFTLTLGERFLGPSEVVRYDNVCVYALPDEFVTGRTIK